MRVLIAYDGSPFAEAAIADLTYAGLPSDTEARIVHAIERPLHDLMGESLSQDLRTRVQAQFPSWNVQMETVSGHAVEMILRRATEWHADVILLGSHGRSGLARVVLGSVSASIARDARCSVRVVHTVESRRETAIRLLVGHDGSPEAGTVVDEVCRRSWPAGTPVQIVSVIEALVSTRADELAGIAGAVHDINAEEYKWLQYLAGEAEQKCAKAGLVASSLVLEGHPKETLVNEARRWNASTIFIGARGLGVVERLFLGSVSISVVTHAPCTVEVVRIQRDK